MDLDVVIVDCMYSFFVYICFVLYWEIEVCLMLVFIEKRIFFLFWFIVFILGIGLVCLIILIFLFKMDRKIDK